MGATGTKKLNGLLCIAVIIGIWQCASYARLTNPLLLPAPFDIVRSFGILLWKGRFFLDVAASIKRVLAGFVAACAFGIPCGIYLGWHARSASFFVPAIEFVRPIPPLAWIPLAILWFGVGDSASCFITGIASFFPVFVNSLAGARSVEQVHINAARSLGASKRFIIAHVLLPAALPSIFTGMRVGLAFGWMSVIAAEMIAAQSGLGYMIQAHRMLLNIPEVMAGMAAIGIVGSLMNFVLCRIQRYVIPWRHEAGH